MSPAHSTVLSLTSDRQHLKPAHSLAPAQDRSQSQEAKATLIVQAVDGLDDVMLLHLAAEAPLWTVLLSTLSRAWTRSVAARVPA